MGLKLDCRTRPWEELYARKLLIEFRKTPPELVKNICQFPPWLWDKLRHNGARVKDLVVGHLPRNSRPARRMRNWQWELYKYSCPTWVPWFIYITERQYSGLFERKRQRVPTGSSPFADLPPARRAEAENLFRLFARRINKLHARRRIATKRYKHNHSRRLTWRSQFSVALSRVWWWAQNRAHRIG